MTKKILIIGANGLVGQALAQEIGPQSAWAGTYHRRYVPGFLRCDVLSQENLEEVFDSQAPSCVVHCAQLPGGVDFCESQPDMARKFHFEATVNIARQCLRHNARFVFISSECVFDGKKEFYNENDRPFPLNTYGKYKAESEEWIQANLSDYSIVRTMSVYGWDPLTVTPNAIMKAYFSILKGKRIHIPDFRWGTPTYVRDLAKALFELCSSTVNGLFHVAGMTFVNRYQWVKDTCDYLGWDSSWILPGQAVAGVSAPRPQKIGLDTEKFRMIFKTELHCLEESLSLLKTDILNYHKAEVTSKR